MNEQDIYFAKDGLAQPRQWTPQGEGARKMQTGMDANQATSLSAMIAYTAHRSGQSEFRIERNLADHFNVPNAKLLSANDFDNAIRYLADIFPS